MFRVKTGAGERRSCGNRKDSTISGEVEVSRRGRFSNLANRMVYQWKQITRVTASAPGRVILFGDYALLRGQPALAAAVGLYTRCKIKRRSDGQVHLSGGGRKETVAAEEVKETAKRVEGMLAGKEAEG